MAKFKVGDKVRIVGPVRSAGGAIGDVGVIASTSNGFLSVREYEGPIFRINNWWYGEDAITLVTAAPKIWRDMTAEEKGALLLAHYEGKVIEVWRDGGWFVAEMPAWFADKAYRVQPRPVAPVVTTQVMYAGDGRVVHVQYIYCTHRIVVTMHDGVPVSVALEPL